MHGIVETQAFLTAVKDARMSNDERTQLINFMAINPDAGEIMPGCGGARKLRYAPSGRGKSGGYRVITYYGGGNIPVFLLTVFSKGEKTNLSMAQRNALAILTKTLRDIYLDKK